MSNTTDTNIAQRLSAVAIRVVGYLIYTYLLFVEIILFLGFFLLLFGANSSAGFVDWVYRSVDRAMRPFRGIFQAIELGTTGNDVPAVFDTSIVFAMIIYGILAIALRSLLDWLTVRIDRIDRENQLRAQQAAYDASRLAAAQAAATGSAGPETPPPAPPATAAGSAATPPPPPPTR